nr:reverse transcriptase domain-containing protein [Tanacetum cinerariifolium]
AWVRYEDLLRACPHYGFTELHQLDTFYNALNPADQDSLNSAAGGNLLERRTQDVLTIIENKSKVRNYRNKSIVSQVKSSDTNSSSSSEIAKLTHAVNQPTNVMTTAMTTILKQFPTFVKYVKEICVTCGGAHPYYHCLAADGNTFLEFQDNIQGYVSAAAVNYNQGELKSITTRSGLVLDGPFSPMPPPFINLEEDERVEETLTDPKLNYLEDLFATNHLSCNPTFYSHTDLTSPKFINPLSGSTTSSPNHLLKEFAEELALITFPSGNDDLPFDIKSDPFINLEEDERVEETLTDPKLSEFIIKVLPPLV